jgi:hypothetical protein
MSRRETPGGQKHPWFPRPRPTAGGSRSWNVLEDRAVGVPGRKDLDRR